jgi:predicted  nucleic acid-binding Zn-ribbon protein
MAVVMSAARPGLLGVLLLSAFISTGAGISVRGAAQQKVTPVEKVIELLKGLQTQLEEEAKAEAAQYDKYACFCKEQVDEKQYLIEKSEKKIEGLSAEISKLDADIVELNDAIGELAKSIAALESEIKEAAEERAAEHKDYLVKAKDMSDAIAALEGAIEALKASKAEMTDAKLDLAQKASRAVGVASKSSALAFTQQQLKAVSLLSKFSQDPTVYGYHSNEIIATLDGLRKYFLGKKQDLDTAEFEANAAWEKRDLNLKNTADFQSRDKAEKEKISAYKSELKEKAEAERTEEESDMNADGQFLAVIKEECQTKAELWDQRSSTRTGELTAIASALEDLTKPTGAAANYDANKKLVGLQASKKAVTPTVVRPASFLQRRAARRGAGRNKADSALAEAQRVAEHLASAGQLIHSPVLTLAALRVRSAEDHFVKVRQIIKDLVARLEADAESEESQKSFCDEAMKDAMKSRDDANSEIEMLAAEKAKLESEMATLVQEIADLAAAIAELKKALIDATDLREAEKAENEKTIASAEEGEEAVKEALKTLTAFYSTALVQKNGYVPPNSDREGKTVSDRAPDIFDATYHGDQTESKGIIGLLEVIVSDFQRTIVTVTNEEEIADAAYQKFKKETEADIDEKETSKEAKETRVAAIKDLLTENTDKTNEEDALLKAALAQLEGLHGQCVAGEETYDDRVAKREKEIEALKEALQILIDWQS